MVDSQVVEYVRSTLAQGYSVDAISKVLRDQGISPSEIKSAFDMAYAQNYYESQKDPSRKNYEDYKLPSSKKIGVPQIGIIILILFGVTLLGFAIVMLLSDPVSDPPVSTTRPPVDTQRPEVPTTPTTPSQSGNGAPIILENDSSIEADTNDSIVVQPPSGSNGVENGRDSSIIVDPAPPTQPSQPSTPSGTTQPSQPITVTDPMGGSSISDPFNPDISYSNRQIELKVQHFKVHNPQEALKFCDLRSGFSKEYCIIDVATASRNVALCERVSDDSVRDDCYLEFILKNIEGEEFCANILNAFKRSSCRQLASLQVGTPSTPTPRDPTQAINYLDTIADVS